MDKTTVLQFVYLITLGLVPSIAWLLYFLRKDNNPEPKLMVLKVFFYGFGATFVAFGIEWVFIKTVVDLHLICRGCEQVLAPLLGGAAVYPAIAFSPFAVLGVLAFIEEWIKYAAARAQIARSRFFDEPIDAMIYLIVAALGFAAAENIGYILQNAEHAIAIAYLRFLSSTFLHVLASGIVGYFFALSLVSGKHRFGRLAVGLGLATALHAVFNLLIMTSADERDNTLLLVALMFGSFAFVSYLFRQIRKLSFRDTLQ